MTYVEIRLLRALCRSDHKTYLPRGAAAGYLQEFDQLVETLWLMAKAGWIELKVSKTGKAVQKYHRKYRAAAARCTEQGRAALRMLGDA